MDLLPGSPSPVRAKKPPSCAKARTISRRGGGWAGGRRWNCIIIDGLPLAWLKDHFTRCVRIGPRHHRDGVNAPSNEEIDRDGVEEALVGCQPEPCDLTALFKHAEKKFHFPPCPIPLPHQARGGEAFHRDTRQ